jgi:hypothetical protein
VSTDETKKEKNGTEDHSSGRTKYSPVPISELRKQLPTAGKPEVDLEGTEKNFADVLGTEIGIGQRDAPESHAIVGKIDPYQWLERTSLTNEERAVYVGMIALAEHGIGGEALDIPIPWIGEDVIHQIRAARSRTDGLEGQSSGRFKEEMTAWLQKMKAEAEERAKQSAKGVGA